MWKTFFELDNLKHPLNAKVLFALASRAISISTLQVVEMMASYQFNMQTKTGKLRIMAKLTLFLVDLFSESDKKI